MRKFQRKVKKIDLKTAKGSTTVVLAKSKKNTAKTEG